MSIAVSIFLSSLFLGCVFLYIKSESKEKWRKYLLFLVGIPLIVFVSIFLYLIIDEEIEKRSDKTEPQKETSKFPTNMKGIRLGETLSNLEFEFGKFIYIFSDEGYRIFAASNRVLIYEKSGIAERLRWNCPSNPFEDLSYFHKIRCGNSSDQIFQAYKKNEIRILCGDGPDPMRLYDISSKRIRLWLRENQVIYIEFSTIPVTEHHAFNKLC